MVTGLGCVWSITMLPNNAEFPVFTGMYDFFSILISHGPSIQTGSCQAIKTADLTVIHSHVVLGLLSGLYRIYCVLPLALPEENPRPTGVSRIFPLI